MCVTWPLQPFSATKAAMMNPEPTVKLTANFEGAMIITGKNRANARTRNSPPAARSAANHVNCDVDGICMLCHAQLC